MKQRVISAAVAILLLAGAACLMDTIVFNVMVFLLMCLCAYEIVSAVGQKKLFGFPVLLVAMAAAVCFLPPAGILRYYYLLISAFAMLYFTLAILYSKRLPVGDSAVAYFIWLIYMNGLFAWLAIKDHFGSHGDSVFLFIMTLALPLLGDMFAYFFGRAFGKRKLCEHISPKKTVAGAVAAVGLSPLYSCLCLFIYTRLPAFAGGRLAGVGTGRLYLCMALLGLAVSFFGIFGDLTSSAVKRKYGIKDFGKIMPGHGGAADRLDSVCFTAPLTAAVFLWVTGYFAA